MILKPRRHVIDGTLDDFADWLNDYAPAYREKYLPTLIWAGVTVGKQHGVTFRANGVDLLALTMRKRGNRLSIVMVPKLPTDEAAHLLDLLDVNLRGEFGLDAPVPPVVQAPVQPTTPPEPLQSLQDVLATLPTGRWSNANWDTLFDWYHHQRVGPMTLGELAHAIGKSPLTVNSAHSDYLIRKQGKT